MLLKFKRKELFLPEIPRWEDLPYSSLALKWALVGGPCEQWGSQLKEAELLDVLKYIQKWHTGKEPVGLGKHGWILLTVYQTKHQQKEQLLKFCNIERQMCVTE